jgi:molybdenum cofactor cytidylyltransferase
MKPAAPPIALGVVILAAGASSRMGRPKMLLPWKGTTLLGYAIKRWTQVAPAQLAVVCAADNADVAAELDRLASSRAGRVINPNSTRGMFSSIQCAARWEGWKPGLTHWAIGLGDQPELRPATVRALIGFAAQNQTNICQPAFGGRARHPVVLPRLAWNELAVASNETLRDFLHARSANVRLLQVTDPGVALDLDDPGEYERALAGAKRK